MRLTEAPAAVLFDLDDTLLSNDMEVFLPAYFGLLSRHAAGRIDPSLLVKAIRAGAQAMMTSRGTLNRDVFWTRFSAEIGESSEVFRPLFEDFYLNEFHKLRECTQAVVGASEVVRWFSERKSRLVLATNPLYPHSAIVQRLEWAGFREEQFELLTTYDNMHSTKPDVGYYREIMERIGVSPADGLMVGNDWDNDVVPAKAAGLGTFHVVSEGCGDATRGSGSLREWFEVLSSGG